MSHPFDEPLTPQERAMADRLARLGPHDGPSPALDAKILAAAHAAVAPRRRRRWLALTGIPATLVTGAGMAAVLALAVGVVWQLRPSAPAPRAPRGESDDFGYVTAEVIQRAEPATAAAAADAAAPPPPPPPAEAVASTRPLAAPAMARREVAPATAGASAADQPAAKASDHFLDEAVDPAHTHPAQVAAAPAGRSEAEPRAFSHSEPASPASPPAPPPAPAAAAPARAEIAAEGEQRQRAAAQADAAARQKSTVMANEAAKQAEARELRSQAASVAAAEADAAADTDGSSTTLDRIEVTGSTFSVGSLPVRADRDLAPEPWLQRIRERRDSGDLDGARQSLELFRKAHPRLRLPDDLRALAAPTR